LWSAEEKAAAGLEEIIETPAPDARLYLSVVNDGVRTNTPRDLVSVKLALISQVETTQGEILAQTDWAYIRLADIRVAVPAAIKAYRDAVRASADAAIAAIAGATTIEEMATVLASEVMQWPTGNDK
jgi:hypothetical protein